MTNRHLIAKGYFFYMEGTLVEQCYYNYAAMNDDMRKDLDRKIQEFHQDTESERPVYIKDEHLETEIKEQ